jgi:hypothetical protein
MYAFKLNSNENHKCKICGEKLPSYFTKYHKVILFSKEQMERLKFNGWAGEYVEYNEKYPTINFSELDCKPETEILDDRVKFLEEEIIRLQKKIQQYENNQPLKHRKF